MDNEVPLLKSVMEDTEESSETGRITVLYVLLAVSAVLYIPFAYITMSQQEYVWPIATLACILVYTAGFFLLKITGRIVYSNYLVIPLLSAFTVFSVLYAPEQFSAELTVFLFPILITFFLPVAVGLFVNISMFAFIVFTIGIPGFQTNSVSEFQSTVMFLIIYLFVVIFSTILEALRKRIQSRLKKTAFFDSLTGYPNRNLMEYYLEKMISFSSRRKDNSFSIVMLDIDHFKRINDSLGHAIGNKLLSAITTRIHQSIRTSDFLARVGGDSFAVLLTESYRDISAIITAQRIMASLQEPIHISHHEFSITASIGICNYPQDGDTSSALLQNAEIAMFIAKQSGRNTYRFFQEEFNQKIREKLEIERQLRTAMERRDLEVFFQPKVDMVTSEIHAVEALLRWNHPVLGSVPPEQFIEISEECGLIHPITRWMFRKAVFRMKAIHDMGFSTLCLAVNISPLLFKSKTFLHSLRAVMDEAAMSPQMIELEITERLLLEPDETVQNTLMELKRDGYRLAIDDFGKGHSSLNYLKEFQVDSLKIDREFVSRMETDTSYREIVKAIIALSRSLNLRSIAEGVENEDQYRMLKEMECEQMQGHYYSEAISFDDLLQKLHSLTEE
jgi:diguanylate cyclase (GGDEF)-like protein